ncbi:MAG: NUDIX hydrolase [Candidatus Lindowbacteria bacterium]|nr:NUDIX hydrolase [Candidatus Lindowbacteria bacterium]
MLSDTEVVLIRQFRHSAGKIMWEIPAGTFEPGEEPLACAERELVEETGYRAAMMKPLGGFYTSPGFCDEFIHLFVATGLQPCASGAQKADSDEQINVNTVAMSEALRKIESGEIVDGKTIVGLMRVSSVLRGGGTT